MAGGTTGGSAIASVVLVAALSACGTVGGDSEDDSGLSPFVEGASISGRVLQNSTACVVDAVCYLRIVFADDTIDAVYGTGERPAPPCSLSVEVSDEAFGAEPGEVVEVVISRCGNERHYLDGIVRGDR